MIYRDCDGFPHHKKEKNYSDRIRELKKEHQPDSKDPDFWGVWTGEEEREVDWKKITEKWQKEGDNTGD